MKIYSAYLTKEYMKLVIFNEGVFIFLYLITDFIQKIPDFIEAHISAGRVWVYFLSNIPLIITIMMPPAALIAAIILFSAMARKNEITAIKASGVNLLRFIRPVLIATFFICLGIFLLSEVVVPYASSKANQIWKIDVKKEDPSLFYGSNQIWYKKDNCIYWIKHFDGKKMLMEGVVLYFFDNHFQVVKKLEAEKAVWKNGKWKLEKVFMQERQADGHYRSSQIDFFDLESIESPALFKKRAKKPEELSYWQLERYARQVKEEGYDNRAYLVDLYFKTAVPFISFIIVLVGIPLALLIRKGGTPLAITLGIGICFLYFFALRILRSFGLSEALPPILAAWIGNFIFLFFGSYLVVHIRR
ncbi:MAG: LPS export ABC transporter permease LptG [Desulfobacteraceae bacterium]|nr:MAG: LPS export ABC transporter permease LptG [Desulfobacteraceae bacterium]